VDYLTFVRYFIQLIPPLATAAVEANNHELGDHLAKNETRHVFLENDEENMVKELKKLAEAYNKGGSQAWKDMALQAQKGATERSSKHSAVFHSDEALRFYLAVLRLGEPFHQLPCMKLNWAESTFRGVHGGVSEHRGVSMLNRLTDGILAVKSHYSPPEPNVRGHILPTAFSFPALGSY